MNRAPGPNDFWWKEHQSTCGGSYIKIREPPGFSEKKAKQNNKKGNLSQMSVSEYWLTCHIQDFVLG